jgi:molybdopterin converting factor small subunit
MNVRAQFFAQLRDVIGVSEKAIELIEGGTVADLLDKLYEQTPALRPWDKKILIGAGLEFVGRDQVLRPNEEIAIMPPVQGG